MSEIIDFFSKLPLVVANLCNLRLFADKSVYGCDRSTNPVLLKIDIDVHVRYTKIRDEVRFGKKKNGSSCVRWLYKMVT